MATDATASNGDDKRDEEPKSLLEKAGAALPVALTALAAVFGSMSNGALQEAMYWKSQAAQDQAKATNQWTLAGFKVNRALEVQTAAAQLAFLAAGKKAEFAPDPNNATEKQAAEWLNGKGPPAAYRRGTAADKRGDRVGLPDLAAPEIGELLDMIRKREREEDILKKAGRIDVRDVHKAIDEAESANEKITEGDWDPVVQAARKLIADARKKGGSDAAAGAALQAAQFEMEQRRYRSEATLNQEVGFLYEARVKVSSAESDKHRKKSEFLSYAMLVAQIGAVASSLALARKQKSPLWLFAGLIGLVAIVVGGYAMVPPKYLPF